MDPFQTSVERAPVVLRGSASITAAFLRCVQAVAERRLMQELKAMEGEEEGRAGAQQQGQGQEQGQGEPSAQAAGAFAEPGAQASAGPSSLGDG